MLLLSNSQLLHAIYMHWYGTRGHPGEGENCDAGRRCEWTNIHGPRGLGNGGGGVAHGGADPCARVRSECRGETDEECCVLIASRGKETSTERVRCWGDRRVGPLVWGSCPGPGRTHPTEGRGHPPMARGEGQGRGAAGGRRPGEAATHRHVGLA